MKGRPENTHEVREGERRASACPAVGPEGLPGGSMISPGEGRACEVKKTGLVWKSMEA